MNPPARISPLRCFDIFDLDFSVFLTVAVSTSVVLASLDLEDDHLPVQPVAANGGSDRRAFDMGSPYGVIALLRNQEHLGKRVLLPLVDR